MADLTEQQLADLDHAYGYHAPTSEQVEKYQAINEAAKRFERIRSRFTGTNGPLASSDSGMVG